MPRRTQGSTKTSKGSKAATGEQGSGRDLPKHMPQAGEIVELRRVPCTPGFTVRETIYVRVLSIAPFRVDGVYADICGTRQAFYVEGTSPGTQGHPYRTVDVYDTEWDLVFGRC